MKKVNPNQTDLFAKEIGVTRYNIFNYNELFTEDDLMAIRYKMSNSDRERGKIAMHFYDLFKPMVIDRIAKFNEKTNGRFIDYYTKEGMLIWGLFVCSCLNKWTGQSTKRKFCSFFNFLYTYADLTVASTLKEKHAIKDNRYKLVDGGEIPIDNFVVGCDNINEVLEDLLIDAKGRKMTHDNIATMGENEEVKQAILEIGTENVNSFTGSLDTLMMSFGDE